MMPTRKRVGMVLKHYFPDQTTLTTVLSAQVIELLQLIHALEGGDACWPDFTEAFEIQKVLEAVKLSSEEVRWCSPQSMITN